MAINSIGIKVSDTVNGESVSQELDEIFTRAGSPQAILKDKDATLGKGVRLWSATQKDTVAVIDDIGHVLANALKKQFEKAPDYKAFTALVSHGATCLRQTEWAFLKPPKLRSKGRFQSISKLGDWATQMLNLFATPESAPGHPLRNPVLRFFPGLGDMRDFIERFARTSQVVSEVCQILKTQGLNPASYQECYALSKTLPQSSKVKTSLQDWLKQQLSLQKQLKTATLPVSSDIIESLFGRYKAILERSPQADMNRSVLLIPALCGHLTETDIGQALKKTSHIALEQWETKNIPYTVRKKRQDFFKGESKKRGKF